MTNGDDIVKRKKDGAKRKRVSWDPAVLDGKRTIESERRVRVKRWDEKLEGLTVKMAGFNKLRDREVAGTFIGSAGQRSAEETVEG